MDAETILTIIIFAGFGAGAYLLSVALKGVKFVPAATGFNGFSNNSDSTEYGTSTNDMLTNPAYNGLSSNIYHED